MSALKYAYRGRPVAKGGSRYSVVKSVCDRFHLLMFEYVRATPGNRGFVAEVCAMLMFDLIEQDVVSDAEVVQCFREVENEAGGFVTRRERFVAGFSGIVEASCIRGFEGTKRGEEEGVFRRILTGQCATVARAVFFAASFLTPYSEFLPYAAGHKASREVGRMVRRSRSLRRDLDEERVELIAEYCAGKTVAESIEEVDVRIGALRDLRKSLVSRRRNCRARGGDPDSLVISGTGPAGRAFGGVDKDLYRDEIAVRFADIAAGRPVALRPRTDGDLNLAGDDDLPADDDAELDGGDED